MTINTPPQTSSRMVVLIRVRKNSDALLYTIALNTCGWRKAGIISYIIINILKYTSRASRGRRLQTFSGIIRKAYTYAVRTLY